MMSGETSITPIILTFNEEANLRRSLESLQWASRVVIVDSGSSDGTKEIAASFANVAWFEHPFTTYAAQWTWATTNTAIQSTYVLALDADMIITEQLARELRELAKTGAVNGGIIPFIYAMQGHALRASILRPQPRFLRLGHFSILDSGHNNEFVIEGPAARLTGTIIHDDRKSADRWLDSQFRYSRQDLPRLVAEPKRKGLKTWIRTRFWFTPWIVGAIVYLRCGGPFGGRAGRKYALERAIYEALLQYRYVDHQLRTDQP